jgi:hypothetical protein
MFIWVSSNSGPRRRKQYSRKLEIVHGIRFTPSYNAAGTLPPGTFDIVAHLFQSQMTLECVALGQLARTTGDF